MPNSFETGIKYNRNSQDFKMRYSIYQPSSQSHQETIIFNESCSIDDRCHIPSIPHQWSVKPINEPRHYQCHYDRHPHSILQLSPMLMLTGNIL